MERQTLRSGPLRCTLEDGVLRWITLALPDGGEREVVRGVYAAVRDHNWGTPAPRFTRYDVESREDSFGVGFTAEHVADEIDLVWEGAIDGSADGAISFSMDALARSAFRTNRLGFCVLHPMEAAGSEVEVEHTDGSIERGTFPADISPHQPFFDIAALRQTFSGITIETRFEGEVFEMEDQRNWTDASFKTYCTPLARPYPVQIPSGARIQQRVVVQATGARLPALAPLPRPLADHAGLRPAQRGTQSPEPPAVGVQLSASHTAREVELLRPLRLSHLWVTLHLTNPQWEQQLAHAAREAAQLACPLEIEAICSDQGAGIDGLAARLATDKIAVSALHVYPKSGVVTTEAVAKRARDGFKAAQLNIPTGGGTRADFVNLNRATVPLAHLDFLAFAINPQVHAFDDASIMETLDAQTVVLHNAQRIAQGRPIRVGTITLRQRLNPAATGPEPPPEPDPRQRTDFCAEWTRRSLEALSGAQTLTYFEATGHAGLMQNGQPFPVYHVLATR